MPKTTKKDTLDPVDRVIARLYRSALSVSADGFRAWALQQIQSVVPCDGALWGSGVTSYMRFHTVTVTGLPPEFPHVLEATSAINPLLPRILQNLDTPVDMANVLPDEAFFSSEIYARAFKPYGITRILSTGHLDPRSGLYSLVTLYRRDREQAFTEIEKAQHKRLTYHLFNAGSHAFFLHLARTHAERPAGAGAAVVDAAGAYHEATVRFLDLLDERFPQRDPHALPLPVPPPGQTVAVEDLMLRCEPLGDLLLLTIWPAGPLDRLTSREREIVFSIAQGLSFKQAAKKIGVAPSTVANHLYRVYRKLGVYSRTELAALVHPPSDE
ncbi:helix-turn-helix transcriptional regulator [Sinimarinibacterium flocculans]|uniref:Regulatory LuxR family protein n=1 Tax=Sinimarinibacterium flocculans TaxID=985250 RepID=A0A318E296_9GAMM|nr:LuxR family transcriptional regulator [Sinimarinibacterium flocculans]MEC9363976.1 LuxR C-terminal-related transcriptional regulator [Pseudomonadota bacterium]PXV63967.1 regulatory LuxR family protein [Sinimarinibacterium flocculans]